MLDSEKQLLNLDFINVNMWTPWEAELMVCGLFLWNKNKLHKVELAVNQLLGIHNYSVDSLKCSGVSTAQIVLAPNISTPSLSRLSVSLIVNL